MSFGKNIPSLMDLCLQNFAENIVYHSHIFRNSSKSETLRTEYSIFQRDFAAVLVNRLFLFYVSDWKLPFDCLFLRQTGLYKCEYNKEDLQMCLDFIFSEETESIFINYSCRVRQTISDEVLSHIFTKCKRLKRLDLHRMRFEEGHFLKALPRWNNLVKLNLSHTSCTDVLIMRMWDVLLDLQELILSFCWEVTDASLLYLCKTQHKSNSLQNVCRELGCCNSVGKKLKILDIDCTGVTLTGVKCALLHLQSLEYFFQADVCSLKEYVSLALKSFTDTSSDEILPSFNLKQVNCENLTNAEDILQVLFITPGLQKLGISASVDNLEILTRNYIKSIRGMRLLLLNTEVLHTVTFQNFIKKYGRGLQSLVLNFKGGEMQIRHIIDVLKECSQLKELRITGNLKVVDVDNGFMLKAPDGVQFLEEVRILDLTGIREMELSHYGLFLEMLKHPKKLHIFLVSSFIAEHLLSEVLDMSSFSNLEKIAIKGADMRKIPIERFMSKQSNLKELELSVCLIDDSVMQRFGSFTKENNIFLNVNHPLRDCDFFRTHRCCQPDITEMMGQIYSSASRELLNEFAKRKCTK